jgi:hypothetical protein
MTRKIIINTIDETRSNSCPYSFQNQIQARQKPLAFFPLAVEFISFGLMPKIKNPQFWGLLQFFEKMD